MSIETQDDAAMANLAVNFAMTEMMRQMIGDVYHHHDINTFRDRLLQFQEQVVLAINNPSNFGDAPRGIEQEIKKSASDFVRTVLSSMIQKNGIQ